MTEEKKEKTRLVCQHCFRILNDEEVDTHYRETGHFHYRPEAYLEKRIQ